MHLGLQLVDCLEHVHSMGFVYNDLKQDNIIVGRHGTSDFERSDDCSAEDFSKVFLIDFGLI